MMTVAGAADRTTTRHRGDLAAMALGALGVVYGDIGTSPLYTFKTALEWAGGEATPAVALGMLSLIVWTLLITTSIKYVAIIMRADNDGEIWATSVRNPSGTPGTGWCCRHCC
jgi:KUP system potassium uptake protein